MGGPALSLFQAFALAFAALSGWTHVARAANWPDHPVKLVVANPAGGSADRFGRLLGGHLSAAFGQQFIVENMAGASGAIAATQVARAAPDGYTLMVGASGPHVSVPLLSRVKYDPVEDFTHVAMIGGDTYVLAANPTLGVHSLADLLALARHSKDPLNCATPSANSLASIVLEQFRRLAGIELVYVPYRGGGVATTDLLGNQVSLAILPVANLGPMMRENWVVPLAVASRDRNPAFPDIPTLRESGFPQVTGEAWFWLAGPKGLPEPLVNALRGATIRALDSPELKRQFETEASIRRDIGPGAMGAFVAEEIEHWRGVMTDNGMNPTPPARSK